MYLILIETPHVCARYVHIVSSLHLIHILYFLHFFSFPSCFEKIKFFIFIFIVQKFDKNN